MKGRILLLLILILCFSLVSLSGLASAASEQVYPEGKTVELFATDTSSDIPGSSEEDDETDTDISEDPEEEDEIVDSGDCGEYLIWSLNSDGLLTVGGTGAMVNYGSASEVPWSAYSESIKNVRIAAGVTSIGDYAFCQCTALESVTIPIAVTSIGQSAFSGCDDLSDITYGGTEQQWEEIVIGASNEALSDEIVQFGLPGDVSGDGIVNILDVLTLLKYVAGQSVTMAYDGDVDNSGTVDILDVLLLLKYVAGQTVTIY